ncbi:MAG TPA: ABC transporter permease [Anaerolineaceae bacterium]|nr:ABC transporter permease [Anaerolineaceae bacterium]
MTQYIIRRLLILPLILFGVTLLIFGMISFLSPAERAALYIRDIPKNASAMDTIIERYGLDDPIPVQYWHWLVGREDPVTHKTIGGILRGDFGYSRSASQPVVQLIKRRFPATLELALWSIVPIIGIGIWMGILAAVNHNKPIDQVFRIFSILGYSFPSFVFGLLVLMFFYAQLGWFPPGRVSDWANAIISSSAYHQYTSLVTIDALLNGRVDIFLDALRHMVLPILTLSYINWAAFLRVTRSSMLETLRQEYVVTARAKGLRERDVVNKHARPNALIPVTTYAGLVVASLLAGVIITETIFNYPGIGSAAAAAAVQIDVITVLAFTLLTGLILILANLVVDVMYAFLDPRVRLA